jgi:prepilin-type N-terminal cleavage/methylation domain-containing protein
MNGGKRPLGYTIVEVLIVLAVSGLMFMIAANFISGKQGKTAFTAGVQEMAVRIQDVIDQVNNGRYSDRRFTCRPAVGNFMEFFHAASDVQGTNALCVFIGKYFHFNGAGEMTDYEVFTLAGRRLTSDSKPPASLAEAEVTPIDDRYSLSDNLDLTSSQRTPQQLQVPRVKVDGSNASFYGFGFVQGLGRIDPDDPAGNTYSSGYEAPKLIYGPGHNSAGQSRSAASDASRLLGGNLQFANRVRVCVTDGERFAIITIGDSGNQLSVRVTRHERTFWEQVTQCG